MGVTLGFQLQITTLTHNQKHETFRSCLLGTSTHALGRGSRGTHDESGVGNRDYMPNEFRHYIPEKYRHYLNRQQHGGDGSSSYYPAQQQHGQEQSSYYPQQRE